jgi:hypothetical protein
MPAVAEVAGVAGEIRRLEVAYQVNAHEPRSPAGYKCVARKITVNLHSEAEDSQERYHAADFFRLRERPIDERTQRVGNDHLLEVPQDHPGRADAEILTANTALALDLWQQVGGFLDRTGNELGKKRHL